MTPLYVALDFNTEREMENFLAPFHSHPIPVKIGMSQFYMSGPALIEKLSAKGFPIFLDLKCHDIPNTVYLALKQLSQYPVDMVTVHCLGGQKMMEAAVAGANEGPYRPKVMGITQLTSTSKAMLNEEMAISGDVITSVISLAQLAKKSGLDGVVSSVLETRAIKQATAPDFLNLTPGIRLEKAKNDDQTRIATPAEAREAGSDYLVVGRPITQAKDPLKAYQAFVDSWNSQRKED
ncbi:MAG: orotidine-5'-phosphate decarboxylase [Aerococcus sp.]|nr:orotidine-5'-phosphate decarboxylase [Aerococcus sp.]